MRFIDVVSALSEKCMPLLMQVENNCSPSLVVVLFCSCNFASVRLRPSPRAHGICAAVPKSAKARYIDWLHAPWGAHTISASPNGPTRPIAHQIPPLPSPGLSRHRCRSHCTALHTPTAAKFHEALRPAINASTIIARRLVQDAPRANL